MRLAGAVLAVLLATVPAAGQSDDPLVRGEVSVKPAAQPGALRKSTTRKATALQARAAAIERGRSAIARQTPEATPAAAGEGPIRLAAAKKRIRIAPTPGPAPNAAGIPPAERIALEFDLAWTGDYNSFAGGDANDKLAAAIRSFQRQRKFRETGALNTQERALLAASAKAKQAQVGWSVLDDAVTGARLGVPVKQTPNKTQSKTGTRWTSAQGQVQIETFKIREPGTTLAAVYEQQRKEPSARRTDLHQLKADTFTLTGMQGLKKFFVRAEFKDGEVRGLTVLWDQATETIVDPIAMAMASAFTPFPAVSTVAQVGEAPRRKVEYGTGIVVSAAGHILTDRQVTDGCNVIVVGGYGDAATLAEDRTADLALIRVYGAPDLVPAALGSEGKGADLTLVGIADPQNQGGGSAITTAAVRLKGDLMEPVPQPGFSGAAALDSDGRFAGLAALKSPALATVGAAAAPAQATVVPLQTIRGFLEAQRVVPAAGKTGIDAAKASVVRVICVRK